MFDLLDISLGKEVMYNDKKYVVVKNLGMNAEKKYWMHLAVESDAPLPAPVVLISEPFGK